MSEREPPVRPRKRRYDGAAILMVVAPLMFLPPFIGLFPADRTLLGVPVIVAWIFGAWGALIAAIAVLSRLLTDGAEG